MKTTEFHFTIRLDRRLLIALGIFFLVTAALTSTLIILFLTFVPADLIKLRIKLKEQTINAQIAGSIPVRADINETFHIPFKSNLPIRVPIKQDLLVPFDNIITVPVEVDTYIPLDLTVHFETEIPVNSSVPIDTNVQTRVLGVPVSVPVKGQLPIRLVIPVEKDIPIHETLRLKFNSPVKAHLKNVFRVPIDTMVSSDIALDQKLTIPIKTSIDVRASLEGQLPEVHMMENNIDIGLDQVSLVRGGTP